MIEVVYNRRKHSVAVKGHAKSGQFGHDLVCAAASMLTYTLAANVSQLAFNHRYVRRPVVDMTDGSATISCKAVHGADSVVQIVFDSVCIGFDVLAKDYPENVKYTLL